LKPGQRLAFAIQRTDKNEKFPYGQDNKVNAKEVGTLAEDFLALVKTQGIEKSNQGKLPIGANADTPSLNRDSGRIQANTNGIAFLIGPWSSHARAISFDHVHTVKASRSLESCIVANLALIS
jgi:protein disulfide-isomerase A1